jgi:hypothetical protein
MRVVCVSVHAAPACATIYLDARLTSRGNTSGEREMYWPIQ